MPTEAGLLRRWRRRIYWLPRDLRLLARARVPQWVIYFGGTGLGDQLLLGSVAEELRQRGWTRLAVVGRHEGIFRHGPPAIRFFTEEWRLLEVARSAGARVVHPRYALEATPDYDVPAASHLITEMCRSIGLTGSVTLRTYFHLQPGERAAGRLAPRQAVIQCSDPASAPYTPLKSWLPERLQAVVDALRGELEFIQLGSPKEPRLRGVRDLRGQTDVRQSAAILAASAVHIGYAGFLMHLARRRMPQRDRVRRPGAARPVGLFRQYQPLHPAAVLPLLAPQHLPARSRLHEGDPRRGRHRGGAPDPGDAGGHAAARGPAGDSGAAGAGPAALAGLPVMSAPTVPAISVVIPTRNPHPERLRRTLEGLARQTLPAARWELLLVDNASDRPWEPPAAEAAALPQLRRIEAPVLGLTPARLAGIRAARGDVLVFVDDDNVLAPGYLAAVERRFAALPNLGAAGGPVRPEWETPPPGWAAPFHGLLALRDLGRADLIAPGGPSAPWPDLAPVGAGLALRRSAALGYAEKLALDPIRGSLDRTGRSLGSGGDNDLVFTVLHAGGDIAYFPELEVIHLIPRQRLDPAYLARLNEGIMRTWVVVLHLHGHCPWPAIAPWTAPLRTARAWLRLQPWRSPARRIRWAGTRGQFQGQAAIRGLAPLR